MANPAPLNFHEAESLRERFENNHSFKRDAIAAEQAAMEADPEYSKWLDDLAASNMDDLCDSQEF